ncbi:arabinofuranosidase [Choiromyces venosus 120613-1]|uniref:Arabinofuranosidase n=1 Tax=Choiromyces venosus 120613-1 TaxID=1336337 RepID=A0A3N4JRK3_9PEZI|nr:arabinofuranosidase [Choiromyces venosus 120613-1]
MQFALRRLLALVGASLLCVGFATGATFSNLLKNPNGSDPYMVYTGGYYYLTTTTWTNIQLTRATTLAGLKTATPVTVWTDSAASRAGNFWAPELHFINSRWYIYYTAGTAECCDNQRLHVLQGGSTPLDSYSYAGRLSAEWGIDGTVLRFPNIMYFVWSRFSPNSLQSIYIATLTPPATLGTPHLLSEPTLSWERVGSPVNEGPAAMYHGGNTYLTYSASYCWTTSYQLGLLTYKGSGDPLLAASWAKTGPVFSSANGNLGTGHNGFFQSPDGTEVWNVYHATQVSAGACDGNRYTMAQKVNWNSDGTPNFGTAAALGTVLTGPSGE